MFSKYFLLSCTLLSASAALHAADTTGDYPNRSVRFIVPYTPGAINDFVARLVAQKLTDSLGQQVIVDNRGGAGGRTRAVNRVPACGM